MIKYKDIITSDIIKELLLSICPKKNAMLFNIIASFVYTIKNIDLSPLVIEKAGVSCSIKYKYYEPLKYIIKK